MTLFSRNALLSALALGIVTAGSVACDPDEPVVCPGDTCDVPGEGGAGGGVVADDDGDDDDSTGGGFAPNVDSGGEGGAGGSEPETCAEVKVEFNPTIPTVALVLDQSGSMNNNLDVGLSRWNAVRSALVADNTGIVSQLQSDVRFGMTLYTEDNGQCPAIQQVDPGLDNLDALTTLFDANSPGGGTPTGPALAQVTALLEAMPGDSPKAIVLATDGQPNETCGEGPDSNAAQYVVDVASAAQSKGITTYVISVGGNVAADHLQDVANAGVGHPLDGSDDAAYYQALDSQALVDDFNTIINGIRPCTFELEGEVEDGAADQGEVLLDGVELGFDDPNGWRLNDASEIELLGEACETIKQGQHDLDVTFPCDTFIEPPR